MTREQAAARLREAQMRETTWLPHRRIAMRKGILRLISGKGMGETQPGKARRDGTRR